MSLLTLTTSQEQEAVHIALEGELDLSSALLFDEELRRIEDDAPADTVVLDLSTLKFMDSTGLRLILSAHQRARRAGRHLRIIPGGDAIRRIFRLTGVWKRLDIVEEDAPAVGDRPSGAPGAQPQRASWGGAGAGAPPAATGSGSATRAGGFSSASSSGMRAMCSRRFSRQEVDRSAAAGWNSG